MVVSLPVDVDVLKPDVRPPGDLPRWVLALFLVQFIVDGVAVHAPSMQFLANTLELPGLVAAAFAGTWLEETVFFAFRRQNAIARFFGALVFSLVALFGAVAGLILVSSIAGAIGAPTNVATNVAFIGLWAAVSSWGSMLVLSVTAFLTPFRPVLTQRIKLTVVGLLVVGTALSLGLNFLASELELILSWADGSVSKPNGVQISGAGSEELVRFFADNPIQARLLVQLAGFALVLPAAWSAATKLAYSVTERLDPLTEAFGRIARGDTHVAVDPGGARDLVFLIDRFNDMATRLTLAKRMERAFGQYVSDQVMERIRDQHGEATLPAQSKEATVLFADIRGFTSMSEKLTPEQVVSLLNRYYTRVVRIINEHHGYLDKFIGDAVVVVFNGPIDQSDHAERAVRCAIAMQDAIDDMNVSGAFPEIGRLKVGIGICTGPMVCGNVGSEEQMEYTVIGDTVNLAARFCGHADAGEVWINEGCRDAIHDGNSCKALPAMQVKGKADPVVPHRVWPRCDGLDADDVAAPSATS